MKRAVLGIDTSCYTTSVACFGDSGVLYDGRTVLPVQKGERGLRQSEGVFLHTRQLPPLVEGAFETVDPKSIRSVCCSRAPVDRGDSYMPVFLTGMGVARALAASLQVPLVPLDHQSGHIRAALIGNEALSDKPFYAVHISGGTTDLLSVERPAPGRFSIEPLGCSEDLHAGQLVDRVGVLLGCGFPAGKQMEALARQARDRDVKIPSSVRALAAPFPGRNPPPGAPWTGARRRRRWLSPSTICCPAPSRSFWKTPPGRRGSGPCSCAGAWLPASCCGSC